MKATKEQMKQEALDRMKLLKLHPNVIKEFKEEDKLNYSMGIHGILYWATDEIGEVVQKFENQTGYLVYHVIHNNTEIGRMLTLLYVSTEMEEWNADKQDLREGCPLAYVENLTYPDCSEFGSVGVKSLNGGVVRTA